MKDLQILTSLEDVKKTAELLMKHDTQITGWEFNNNKVSIVWAKCGFPYNVLWEIQVWVEYNHHEPVLRDFVFLDGNYEGYLTRSAPYKNKIYAINSVSRDSEYHSFQVMSVDGVPMVKTTYYFHDYSWEKAKCVKRFEHLPDDKVSIYYDKPVMFPNKEFIQRLESYNLKKYEHFEPKLVYGSPCWVTGHPLTSDDPNYILYCRMKPHISYQTEHLLPIGCYEISKAPIDEIEIGKEYPLYQLGDCADVSTSNLISVTFDGENVHFVRPSESNLI